MYFCIQTPQLFISLGKAHTLTVLIMLSTHPKPTSSMPRKVSCCRTNKKSSAASSALASAALN